MLLYLVLAPSHPLPRQLDWPPRISRSLLLELRGILLLVILNFLVDWVLLRMDLADVGGQMIRLLFHVAILMMLLRVLWNLGTVRPFAAWSSPRIVAGLAILATVLVEFSGYDALAAFLFRGITLTLLAIGRKDIGSRQVTATQVLATQVLLATNRTVRFYSK